MKRKGIALSLALFVGILGIVLARPLTAQPVKVSIAAGSLGGSWYATVEAMAECVRKTYPGSIVTVVPGDSAGNLKRVQRGLIELGIATSVETIMAIKGEQPFAEKHTDVRAIAVGWFLTSFQLTVLEKLPFSSLEELKKKKFPLRISVNTRGSGMELITKTGLEAAGITYKDIESWEGKILFLAGNPALALLDDGHLDGETGAAGPPDPVKLRASTTHKLRLLPLTEEQIKRAIELLPGTFRYMMPKGVYNFLAQDTPTFSATSVLYAHQNLPESAAYQIARSIAENVDYLQKVNVNLRNLKREELAETSLGIPFHPGVIKYYKEKGLMK